MNLHFVILSLILVKLRVGEFSDINILIFSVPFPYLDDYRDWILGVYNLSVWMVWHYEIWNWLSRWTCLCQAVYGTLFEAEHRSTFYIPYWKFPLASWIVPRQRKFRNDLRVINDCLDGLIRNAKETREVRSFRIAKLQLMASFL